MIPFFRVRLNLFASSKARPAWDYLLQAAWDVRRTFLTRMAGIEHASLGAVTGVKALQSAFGGLVPGIAPSDFTPAAADTTNRANLLPLLSLLV